MRSARHSDRVPTAIVMSPDLYDRLQDPALGSLWSAPKRDRLFGVPVEIDPQASGWALRAETAA
jgi:hypothetical protein